MKGSGWVWSSRVGTEGLAVPNELSLGTWHGTFPGQTGKQGSAVPAAQPHLPGAWGPGEARAAVAFPFPDLWESLLWEMGWALLSLPLSPDAIINENYKYLKGFLEDLAPPERSALIQDWELAGLVYLDYIRVNEMLDRIQQVRAAAVPGLCRLTPTLA